MLTSWTIAVAPAQPGLYADEDEENLAASRSDTTVGDREIELRGDQFEDMTDAKLKLSTFDLWALGITTALGGHCYLWNFGLTAGFGSLIVGFFLVSSAHGCLLLSMAELSGALPFAGGAYGIARVTLGSLPGYLVACFDCYQSMFYTMLSVLLLGAFISVITETDEKWRPLWWFLIYCSYLIVHSIGGLFFWRTLKVLSLGSLGLLLVYILGSIKFADFNENAPLAIKPGDPDIEQWFAGGPVLFFQVLPVYCWMFVGIESLNLASHDAVDPKRDVPRAYMLSYATVCCTALATIFVACSVPPGVNFLKTWFMPQSFGYMLMFDINYRQAFCLSLPAIYTSGFGFMYYYGSQLRAMGKSGLVNPWMGYDVPYFHTPVPALLVGALIGFAVGLRYQYYRAVQHESLFSISLIGVMFTYISQFISFVVFRWYYPTIKRGFVSPLGIAGALYGTAVFGIVLIVIAGFEATLGIIAFGIYIGLLLIYYYLVVRKRQVFSEEEKTVLFKAYLMKSNRIKADRVRIGKARARAAQQQQQNAASLASHGSGSNEAGAGEGAGAGLAMVGLRQKPVASSQRMHVDSYDETYFSTHRIFAGVAAIKSAATAAVGLTITSSHSSDRTISVRCPPSGAEGVTAPVVAPVLRVDTALMTALRAAVGDAVEATAGSAVRVEEQRSAGEKLTTEEKSTAQTTSTATDETASTVAAAVASTHSNSSSGVVPVPSSEEARCSPWEGDREDGIEKV